MKRIAFVTAVLIAAGSWGMPAVAQMRHGGSSIIPHDSNLKPVHSGASNTEGQAEDLRLAGKCDLAVPIFRNLVDGPRDSSVSEYNLGLCLLDLASADTDKVQAESRRREGAGWILRAANSGFNMAESKAALLYLDGAGVTRDPVEAEKWALIYHDNPMRFTLGLPDIAPTVQDRLDAALSEAQRDEAQARADAWSAKVRSFDR